MGQERGGDGLTVPVGVEDEVGTDACFGSTSCGCRRYHSVSIRLDICDRCGHKENAHRPVPMRPLAN